MRGFFGDGGVGVTGYISSSVFLWRSVLSFLFHPDIFCDLRLVWDVWVYILKFQAMVPFLLQNLFLLGVTGCEVCGRPRCSRESPVPLYLDHGWQLAAVPRSQQIDGNMVISDHAILESPACIIQNRNFFWHWSSDATFMFLAHSLSGSILFWKVGTTLPS